MGTLLNTYPNLKYYVVSQSDNHILTLYKGPWDLKLDFYAPPLPAVNFDATVEELQHGGSRSLRLL